MSEYHSARAPGSAAAISRASAPRSVAHHAVVILPGGVAGDASQPAIALGIGVGVWISATHTTERTPASTRAGSARRSRWRDVASHSIPA